MLEMIERLRGMHRAGRVRRVIAFDRPVHTDRRGERDETMGANLSRIDPGANGIVLVLVGNAHAGKGMLPFGPKPYRAAGGFLPPMRTTSLLMVGDAGTAFVCMERCGVNPIGAPRDAERGIVMTPIAEGGYDGVLELGTKTSASPPASPDWRPTRP